MWAARDSHGVSSLIVEKCKIGQQVFARKFAWRQPRLKLQKSHKKNRLDAREMNSFSVESMVRSRDMIRRAGFKDDYMLAMNGIYWLQLLSRNFNFKEDPVFQFGT